MAKIVKRDRKRAILLPLILCLHLFSFAQPHSPLAVAQLYEPATINASKTSRDLARRGEELRRKWELDAAEAAFREAAAIDAANLEAMLGLARIARARFDYKEAARLLDLAAVRHADAAELMAERGTIYLAVEEVGRARRYFEKAIARDPLNHSATVGLAGVEMLERNYHGAELRLRRALSGKLASSRLRARLGQVLLESNKVGEAIKEAEHALATDAFDIDALYTLAFAKSIERKPEEVRALARRALALDPFNAGIRRLLSQYLDGRAGYEQKVSDAARERYNRAAKLRQKGRTDEAVRELEAALADEPRYYRALIALGDIWLRQTDYERAATAARLALEIEPEASLAHLELSYAHSGLQERARIEFGAVDFAARFYKQAHPPAHALTAEIFPNYRSLTREQQIVIDRAVALLAHYLPKLARSGARHHLLAFDQRISDIEGFEDVADEKTFDGRYYASIRGVGGRITVSGIEYIEIAARGGFNTIAHEFAHQVHMTALDRQEVKMISRLYSQARRRGRALDYYAAANEYEYFAQGYEAFISNHKRPSTGMTARHSRSELLARDPDLYGFLVKLTARSQLRALS